jgi:hypothetical protein
MESGFILQDWAIGLNCPADISPARLLQTGLGITSKLKLNQGITTGDNWSVARFLA